MPFKPPIPLTDDVGRVHLTAEEIEAINSWMDSHKRWRERHQGNPRTEMAPENKVANVLGRLLGHALGTMSPGAHQ